MFAKGRLHQLKLNVHGAYDSKLEFNTSHIWLSNYVTTMSDRSNKFISLSTIAFQGEVTQRAFTEVRFKACPTEAFAREQFKRHGVEHYWNLAYSNSILQTSGHDV